MTWWISNNARARSERQEIADLQERSEWLKNIEWKIAGDLRLSAEVVIEVGDNPIQLTLTYPFYFPDVPPQVIPKEDIRLSPHQYGSGGELCLEFRPDNWQSTYSGAMMLESAHKLIFSEQGKSTTFKPVENAHRTNIAQEARGEPFRVVIQADARLILDAIDANAITEFEYIEVMVASRWVVHLVRIGTSATPTWSQNLKTINHRTRTGLIVRLPNDWDGLIPGNYIELLDAAQKLKSSQLIELIEDTSVSRSVIVLLNKAIQYVELLGGEDTSKSLIFKIIQLPPFGQRQTHEYEVLKDKSVAIVGCGSVGSKVASALARAGLGKLRLIDGDLFYPSNLVRNDLDYRHVGLNKPDAVKAHVQEINPIIEVMVRRTLLGGQESAISTEAAISDLVVSDLIVDATADATIFNLCSVAAKTGKKPLVWGEVFAGGVGGIIARVRPDLEPPPMNARAQLVQWCSDRNVPWSGKESNEYDLILDNAPPLIADDSEVSIIAANITRLVIDTLIREESIFPFSAYAIGLKNEWIFQAPFDTWPIELVNNEAWETPASPDNNQQALEFFRELMPSPAGTPDEG